jgi:hypothetical protein
MDSYAKKAEGVASIVGSWGDTEERKTITCAHCDKLVYVQPGTDGTSPLSPLAGVQQLPPSVCHICWALVCIQCHGLGVCRPLEERLRKLEARAEFNRSAGLE